MNCSLCGNDAVCMECHARSGGDVLDREGWIKDALEMLKAIEWRGDRHEESACPNPACCQYKTGTGYGDQDGHKPDCALARLIRQGEKL